MVGAVCLAGLKIVMLAGRGTVDDLAEKSLVLLDEGEGDMLLSAVQPFTGFDGVIERIAKDHAGIDGLDRKMLGDLDVRLEGDPFALSEGLLGADDRIQGTVAGIQHLDANAKTLVEGVQIARAALVIPAFKIIAQNRELVRQIMLEPPQLILSGNDVIQMLELGSHISFILFANTDLLALLCQMLVKIQRKKCREEQPRRPQKSVQIIFRRI